MTSTQPLTDFEWFRDPAGYELLAGRAAAYLCQPPVEGVSIFTIPPQLAPLPAQPERIVRGGGQLQPYRPFEYFSRLFDQFSKDDSPKGLLNFVERFGPLTNDGCDPKQGEDVTVLAKHATQMRRLLDAYASGQKSAMAGILGPKGAELGNSPIGELQGRLIFDPATERPRLRLIPKNLLNAIWLELAQCVTEGAPLKACLQCGEFFEYGVGTPRRADAKFCSDEHRVAFNSRKRSLVDA